MALTKTEKRLKIKRRVRKKVTGTQEMPRMCIFRSNKHIYASIIDDKKGGPLLGTSSLTKEIAEKNDISKIEKAKLVGKSIAEKAIASGIKKVVFDRNCYLYHGRVKAVADGAREGGLKI
jgi:large subunit ribosomal protein L18